MIGSHRSFIWSFQQTRRCTFSPSNVGTEACKASLLTIRYSTLVRSKCQQCNFVLPEMEQQPAPNFLIFTACSVPYRGIGKPLSSCRLRKRSRKTRTAHSLKSQHLPIFDTRPERIGRQTKTERTGPMLDQTGAG